MLDYFLRRHGQEIAGRERVGIATALLQLTRAVGDMPGTNTVATIANCRYAAGVEDSLRVRSEPVASAWLPKLGDPCILIDPARRIAY